MWPFWEASSADSPSFMSRALPRGGLPGGWVFIQPGRTNRRMAESSRHAAIAPAHAFQGLQSLATRTINRGQPTRSNMRLTILGLALSLPLCAVLSLAAVAQADPSPPYSVSTTGGTLTVSANTGYHINSDYPWK